MQKLKFFVSLLIIAILISGFYGMLNDQITYTISPEYYTKFKFYQFGLIDSGNQTSLSNPRIQVAIVGWMATWWMGLFIGLFLGFIGLFSKDSKKMFWISMKAFFGILLITFLAGFFGFLHGHFYLFSKPKAFFIDWYFPENLIDYKNFITVGSIHNFSYFGGIIGLFISVFYCLWENQKFKS